MNDLDLCFRDRIKVTSTIVLHLTLNVSETVRDRGLIRKDHNRKWHMGYRMVTWPMTSRDPQRCCEAVRLTILATAWLLVINPMNLRLFIFRMQQYAISY